MYLQAPGRIPHSDAVQEVTMLVVLSALAALGYGVSDFAGGVAARRIRPMTALLYGEPAGLLVVAVLLVLSPSGQLNLRVVVLGGAAGLCGLVGLGLMYRLMAEEPLNVVSPITAVVAAAMPLLFGIAAGEHPGATAWTGAVVGLLAVALISGDRGVVRAAVRWRIVLTALVSGAGFGAYFVLVAHAGDSAGAWPLVCSRLCALAVLVPIVWRRRAWSLPSAGCGALAVGAGAADAVADMLFLLASRNGYLSLAGVITAFYPVVTVVLAVVVLRERTGWVPRAGLALSAVSLALIAT
jgi:drug/metabolite transporter (DMT)-like permease